MQIIDIVLAAHMREEKQKLIAASFGSWQVIEALKGMLSDKSKPIKFGDYLKSIGLKDKEPIDKKKIEKDKQHALSIAESIKALDQQKKGGSR